MADFFGKSRQVNGTFARSAQAEALKKRFLSSNARGKIDKFSVKPRSDEATPCRHGSYMKTRAALCLIVCPLIFFGSAVAAIGATPGLSDENVKFASPDARFALRISKAQDTESGDLRIDLIETASGKVMVDLETAYGAHLSDTVLVWSADSKWVAYATRGDRQGETEVYFWNGSVFEPVPLPDEMPGPDIKFRKGDSGSVKNYGGAVKPVRWLKSGRLELSSDQIMLSRDSGLTYTGVVLITVGFDAQHHASIKNVSKTKTLVE